MRGEGGGGGVGVCVSSLWQTYKETLLRGRRRGASGSSRASDRAEGKLTPSPPDFDFRSRLSRRVDSDPFPSVGSIAGRIERTPTIALEAETPQSRYLPGREAPRKRLKGTGPGQFQTEPVDVRSN